jgi:transcriptional regulator with XRE-family HTH domain
MDDKAFVLAVGENIRRIRKERNLTLEELAEKLKTSTSQVGKVERGAIITRLDKINRYAKALEVEPCVLLTFLNK